MSQTPNMLLTWPTPSTTPGPTYAQLELTAIQAIDAHDHTTGQGALVPTAGLNINADLSLNGFNLNSIRTLRLSPQSTTPTGASDTTIIYAKNNELAYRDGTGTEVVLTSNGSVAGATGSISGLTSPASAVFNPTSGTYTFSKDTSKPGKLAVSSISIYEYNNASAVAVTIKSPASLGSAYSLTLPTAVPTATSILQSDTSGVLSWQASGLLPVGSIVGTFPNLAGAYTCTATTVADAQGFVLCAGQTIADGTSPMNGVTIPHLNNSVYLLGSTTSGSSGGHDTMTLTTDHLPTHAHDMSHNHSNTFALGGTTTFAGSNHIHNMSHYHGTAFYKASTGSLYMNNTGSATHADISASDSLASSSFSNISTGGASSPSYWAAGVDQNYYTSGALGAPSESAPTNASTGLPSTTATVSFSGAVTALSSNTGNAGLGSAFSIFPTFISTVYVMRVK